jgi:hypothetical protein
MTPGDDPTTEQLRAQQTSKAREERDRVSDAETEDAAAAHDRRSEKAAYLAARLAEQERSEQEKDEDA